MTSFDFWVSDLNSARKAIESIENKFSTNKNVKKALYRKFTFLRGHFIRCDFLLPFPDLRIPAVFMFIIGFIIALFTGWWWIIFLDVIIAGTAYLTYYMLQPPYLFKMLRKGMKKHGYTGTMGMCFQNVIKKN